MNLKEKLMNKEYIDNLSKNSRRELEICALLLTDEELETYTSIPVGYRVARDRLIERIIREVDPEMYEKIQSKYKIPILQPELYIEEWKNLKKRDRF